MWEENREDGATRGSLGRINKICWLISSGAREGGEPRRTGVFLD